MIDTHSHILPAVDDGSQSVEESLALLRCLSEQGVDTVVATPHFYAEKTDVEVFLQRRAHAYEQLRAQLPPDAPRILLGAEVRYYAGISRMEELSSLCIDGTRVLLLEMPCARWSVYVLRELMELSCRSELRIVLAHVERCLPYQPISVWEQLLEQGVRMQANADFFVRLRTRRKAWKLLKYGYIHLLGSDCHNVTTRPPRMAEAVKVIMDKGGADIVHQVDTFGMQWIAGGCKDTY